jgi:hypothetical protein
VRLLRLACLLAAASLLGGCARRYQVTFSHGSVVTVRGKPKYDPATDTFTMTDMRGNTGKVKAISIREIAPASMANESAKPPPFKTAP